MAAYREVDVTDDEFDAALVAAAFADAAQGGWAAMSMARAARSAGLDLARARLRAASKGALLLRFGRMADHAALTGVVPPPREPAFDIAPDLAPDLVADPAGAVTTTPQEILFDMLMRRFDVLQAHRAGVLALLRALPTDPATAVLLANASLGSMRWLLDAADLPLGGARGLLRPEALLGVWLWTVRAWARDDSADLSATMAALDTALARGIQLMRL